MAALAGANSRESIIYGPGMNERWQRIERIFHEARRRKGPDRDNFLREELGDETSIRKEVESLLAEPSAPGSILEAPLAAAAFRVLAQGPEPSLVGETLLQYKIEARIGAGGMGEVYFARDTNLDRKVALKVLSGPSDNKDDAVARLHQEARAASALNHPNIITIYDFGRVDSTDFIAMEFVSGETLREKLRGGRPSVPEAVDIAIQIARALAAAHREGIVHRDIKPENVMVRDDAVVKVLDFGIAKFREEMDAVSNPAQPGTPGNRGSSSVVFGTVHYLAPEQARREVTDALSDIFSLGIVLYEMIAGERPFNAADAAGTINEIINKEPEPLSLHRSSVPPELQGIVSRALNKNRAERFQSASQMMAELLKLKEQLSRGQPNAHVMQPHRDYTRWIMPVAAIFGLLAGLDLVAGVPRGVREILDLGVLSLFSAYGIVILGLRRKRRVPDAASEVVFQGLAPFQEEDRDRFLGREQDTSAMFQMLTQESFRFGVLYGESGCGKSSLIAAGLAPDLRAARFEVVICRSYKDPLKSIVETCWQWCRLAPLEAEQPAEYLARITTEINGHDGAEKGLVIMCDQFEEFFVNLKTQDEREPFLSFVESCTRAKNLRVRFLFCIRADFLHHIISAFDTRVPEPLLGAKRYGLRSFEQERAEEIIVKTAALAGLPIHRELCQAVARDLAPSGTVLASELQIVGAQLQAKRIFNLDDYLRAGGKEQLVHGFLDDLIKSSTDRRTTEALLAAMISGESTRLTLSLDEIVGRTQRDEASVEAVLRQLVRTRLIREVNDYGTSRYELIHEYLIEGINAITGHVIGATRRANRMLRQYVTSYSVDKRTRIPL
ncbi:MAG TPA: serine/threonine-protein kinase, partial [Blastocatellia bacterium]|nr:serine/threonine-protein kinase [Blastocatellia bacterium]